MQIMWLLYQETEAGAACWVLQGWSCSGGREQRFTELGIRSNQVHNEAGRQPVGMGVRCSVCLGMSGHFSRQPAAAVSPCKSLNGFTLLLWALQMSDLTVDMGGQCEAEGLEALCIQQVSRVHQPPLPWGPKAQRCIAVPPPLLQHCLCWSLIVFEEGFITTISYLLQCALIPLISSVPLSSSSPSHVP